MKICGNGKGEKCKKTDNKGDTEKQNGQLQREKNNGTARKKIEEKWKGREENCVCKWTIHFLLINTEKHERNTSIEKAKTRHWGDNERKWKTVDS